MFVKQLTRAKPGYNYYLWDHFSGAENWYFFLNWTLVLKIILYYSWLLNYLIAIIVIIKILSSLVYFASKLYQIVYCYNIWDCVRDAILRKSCCSFGFCPNEGGKSSFSQDTLPQIHLHFYNIWDCVRSTWLLPATFPQSLLRLPAPPQFCIIIIIKYNIVLLLNYY